MPKSCLDDAQNMSKTCPTHCQNIAKTFPKQSNEQTQRPKRPAPTGANGRKSPSPLQTVAIATTRQEGRRVGFTPGGRQQSAKALAIGASSELFLFCTGGNASKRATK